MEDEVKEAYKAALEKSRIVVWTYDIVARRITVAGNEYSKMDVAELGLPSVLENVPDSLVGLVDDADIDAFLHMYDEVRAGRDASCTFRYRTAAGEPARYGEISYAVVKDDTGTPIKAYGCALDSTRFVQMSKKVAQSDKQIHLKDRFLERLYETLPVGIMQCTAEPNPVILNGNPVSFEILGISEEDLNVPGGMHVYDTVYPDDIDLVQAKNHALALKGLNGGSASYSHRIVTPAGTVKWVTMVSQIDLDDNGRPVFTVMMHDITEVRELRQRAAQEDTVERRSFLGAIRAVYARFLFIDLTENRYSLVDNDRYGLKIPLAGDFEQLMADTLEAIEPDYREGYMARLGRASLLQAAQSGKSEERFELRQRFDDGSVHWVDCRTLLLRDEDTGDYLAVSLIQIVDEAHEKRERRARELQEALDAAQAASAAKSDFVSRISHDIRTPLNGIIGMTRIAEEQVNPAETEDALEKIDTSSHFLLGLINDILDLSKVEGGKMELRLEPYPADEFLQYLDTMIRPACEEKGIQFSVEEAGVILDVVPLMDKLRTNQILFNLLSNAIKYTPEGGHVSYTVDEQMRADGLMGIDMIIADDGIGMSQEFQKHLFEPFTQEGVLQSSIDGGSGLGLAIVKRLTDLMGGTVSVESEKGVGSRFTVHVDCAFVPADQVEQPTDAQTSGSARDLTGKHILLCEDHPLNVEIALHMLKKEGMLVTVAEDGQRGLDAFAASPQDYYDAVLMDIRMPVMDGLEATRLIRALPRTDAKTVPIIAMTADAFAEDVESTAAAGMNAHLSKPFEPEQLIEVLIRCCR